MDPFIGEIRAVGFNFAPRSWTMCHGQILSIAQNTSLFSLVGTFYGGDGRTSFGIPELRGRTPIGFGQGPGLANYRMGELPGASTNTLVASNLPQSSSSPIYANAQVPAGIAVTGSVDTGGRDPSPLLNGVTSESKAAVVGLSTQPSSEQGTGVNVMANFVGAGSRALDNYQPSLAVNYIMALSGTYPSRN